MASNKKANLLPIFRKTLTRINNISLKETDVYISFKKGVDRDHIDISIFTRADLIDGNKNCSLLIFECYEESDINKELDMFIKLLKKENFKEIKRFSDSFLET